MRKILKRALVFTGVLLTILLIMSLLYFSIKWMFDTWLFMDELIFHLTVLWRKQTRGMIRVYIGPCVTPTVLIMLTVLVMFLSFRYKKKYYIMSMALVLIMTGITVSSV